MSAKFEIVLSDDQILLTKLMKDNDETIEAYIKRLVIDDITRVEVTTQ